MKIKIALETGECTEHDVTLPIYGAQRLDDTTIFFTMERLPDGGLLRTSLWNMGDKGFELELERYKPGEVLDTSGPGYWLGQGRFASTVEEWAEALGRCRAALPKDPPRRVIPWPSGCSEQPIG